MIMTSAPAVLTVDRARDKLVACTLECEQTQKRRDALQAELARERAEAASAQHVGGDVERAYAWRQGKWLEGSFPLEDEGYERHIELILAQHAREKAAHELAGALDADDLAR